MDALYGKHVIEAIRRDMEREYAYNYQLAEFPRSSFAADVRRRLSASFAGVGKLIRGRLKTEATA